MNKRFAFDGYTSKFKASNLLHQDQGRVATLPLLFAFSMRKALVHRKFVAISFDQTAGLLVTRKYRALTHEPAHSTMDSYCIPLNEGRVISCSLTTRFSSAQKEPQLPEQTSRCDQLREANARSMSFRFGHDHCERKPWMARILR